MVKDKNEMPLGELNKLGEQLFNNKRYKELIDLFSDDIIEKFKSDLLYNGRGLAHAGLNEHAIAIQFYNKALELKPQSSRIYNNRGNSFHLLGEYKNAIEDFNTSISLNESDAEVFFNRGNSYAKIRQYTKAIRDYDSSIRIDKNNHKFYANRGAAKGRKKDYVNAILDLNKAIEINPNDYLTYNNLGVILETKKDYIKALENYEKSITIFPNYIIGKNNLDRIKALLGKKVETYIEEITSTLQLFARILDSTKVSSSKKIQILQICAITKRDALDKIRAHAAKNIDTLTKGKSVVHYTKLFVADKLATEVHSKLRYYNATYMNDPEEGIVLLEHMEASVKRSYHNASFQEEDNIYIGSFLPAESHEDELVMWRTYGKDEKQVDGGGCSIIINQSFFDPFNEKDGYLNPEMVSDSALAITDKTPQCLYRVLYYNKGYKKSGKPMIVDDESKAIEKDVNTLNKKLLELTKLKERSPKSTLNIAIDKIIYHLLSEIRFFFKSADYAFENEIRVLQFAAKNSPLLMIDDKSYPKKVYLESNKPVQNFMEKIILGPKVPNPKQWMYLDVALRQNNPSRSKPVDVSISECKYQ